MDKPFLDKLRKIDPYVPGEQPKTANVIKLNANENPYPPAPGVTEVLRTFDAAKLAVYPDASAKALKTALAEREGLKPSQVFLGNGSDDVLALAFQSFFCSGEPILYPDITYSFYPVWCDLLRIPYETVPLDKTSASICAITTNRTAALSCPIRTHRPAVRSRSRRSRICFSITPTA